MLINIRKFLKSVSLAMFPRTCIGCQTPDFWICHKCLSTLPKSFENPLPWSFSAFEYKNRIIRKAVWLLKFSKKYSVLDDIAYSMNESFSNLLEKEKLADKELVLIPIPITKRSKTVRGYNQSTLICKILVNHRKNVTIEDSVLVKTKNHLPQNKIKNRNERLNNVKNSFRVGNPKKIKGKIIILIDDVVTTGATLKEAKKVLVEAGTKKVLGFSIAH